MKLVGRTHNNEINIGVIEDGVKICRENYFGVERLIFRELCYIYLAPENVFDLAVVPVFNVGDMIFSYAYSESYIGNIEHD